MLKQRQFTPYSQAENFKTGMRSKLLDGETELDGNEFTFVDQKGNEKIYLHARKDLYEDVPGSLMTTVNSGDHHIKVQKGDQTIKAGKVVFKSKEILLRNNDKNYIKLDGSGVVIKSTMVDMDVAAGAAGPAVAPPQTKTPLPPKLCYQYNANVTSPLKFLVGEQTFPVSSMQNAKQNVQPEYVDSPLYLQVNNSKLKLLDRMSALPCDEQNNYYCYFSQEKLSVPLQNHVGVRTQDNPSDIKNVSSSSCHEVYFIPGLLAAKPTDLTYGMHQLEELSEESLNWVVTQLKRVNPDFSLDGESVKAGREVYTLVSTAENRSFLKDLIADGKFYVKKINGKANIVFKGYAGTRNWISGTRYGIENTKVHLVSTTSKISEGTKDFFRGNSAELLKDGLKDATHEGAIGVFIVDAVDVYDYFQTSSDYRDVADLVTKLAYDTLNTAVSTALAYSFVSAATAAMAATPVGLVVVGTIVIGYAISKLMEHYEEKYQWEEATHKWFVKEGHKAMQAIKVDSNEIEHKIATVSNSIESFFRSW